MNMTTAAEPIAVVGSACRFPGDCDTPSKLWELLKSPRDLLREVPSERYNAEAFYHSDPKHHGTTDVRQSYFLNEDPAVFDNAFFSIPRGEAEAIDPQQRMLMETVYDSLCAAGQTIEGLRGSSTAVYVGVMCDDWSGVITKDLELFPQYGATGMARSIMSNRISYFFDWHGPCMTIDTACSSSLVAVHQAVQVLRSGESQVAIAAGANLILTPGMFIAESKLSMLSASARSRMWDESVDGYARGEGIAAVVLKPLSAALRDNDHIECLIRATGVNQDGRTPGLTMPSATAQADLIRTTYARAGLDINRPEDRPQFFHAHGTGTPAGDPQEAEAISRAFYAGSGVGDDKLYVGSIKTVIGHTEGTAGLASLIGTSLALQHGVIPPNMHFNKLNPRIEPFYSHLEVPTKAYQWPELAPGQPRRASINSFGFGGTNAHAIIEAFEPRHSDTVEGPLLTPLTFSASSEASLRTMLEDYSEYMKSSSATHIPLHDLAYTLQTRRSSLAHRVAIAARTMEQARSQIAAITSGDSDSTVGIRQLTKGSPRVLGVFTGQGSQWPRMGVKLLEASPFVAGRLEELDKALSESPAGESPAWTLREMIMADPESSRMGEAAISQPLCTAVQIVLVDLLCLAGVELHAVVGHSSGEIGAAYAAGCLSARDAIRIAYYRGLYAKLAKPSNGCKGAMMAVGTTFEDASEFCELFEGRIHVAARNSSSSITLSGDEDAVIEAVTVFKDEGKFARQLKVDTAYHSHHVLHCAEVYLAAMETCGMEKTTPNGTTWYSSVHQGKVFGPGASVESQYWVDNMTNPVLFGPAVAEAWTDSGPFDVILEVGPHPVLKTPFLDTVEEVTGNRPPYSGLLLRGGDDVLEFSNALGFIWTHLGPKSVSFDKFATAVSPPAGPPRLLLDLPKFPFDRSQRFMRLSRTSGIHNSIKSPPHPLLGKRCHDHETSRRIQWRNILHPKEISWLRGHQIEGQIVFPATGYIAMAVEALNILAGKSSIDLVTIEGLRIDRAMAFNDDDSSVEILFDVNIVAQTKEEIQTEFTCSSGGPQDHKSAMVLNASGRVKVTLGSPEPDRLPPTSDSDEFDRVNIREVSVDRFYESLRRVGYNYSWPFRGTTRIERRADYATGEIKDQSGRAWEDQLIVHPGMLDTALQTTFAAFSCPGDEKMWTLHVPVNFHSIVINPYFTRLGAGKESAFRYVSFAQEYKAGRTITELNLFKEEGHHTFLQLQGMELAPLSAALPENDAVLFSKFDYQISNPDGELTAAGHSFSPRDLQIALDSERISFYYLRRLLETVTAEEKANTLPHYRHLLDWAAHVVPQVINGENPHIPKQAQFDTKSDIDSLLTRHYDRTDVRLLESVGMNLPNTIRDNSNILEHMVKDGMLDDVYEEGFGLELVNEYIAGMTTQIAHRYPRMNIIEIGAGTGGSTRRILPRLDSTFSTYTYTDVSSGFFGTAEDRFHEYAGCMIFKTFDMNQSPASQGFIEGSYDLVIASNVLHATVDLETMMRNVRSLLKPGGHVIILETVHNDCLRVGLPMGSLPGWWLGAETGRPWGPTLTLPQWDSLMRNCGFSGIDTTTPPVHKILPGHVFCGQAIDDRVRILRSPLQSISQLPAPKAPQLVIVGGQTLPTHRISEHISNILAPRYDRIIRATTIEYLSSLEVADSSTILSLAELDDPLFATLTPTRLDALKVIWRQGGNILWLTTGARADNPSVLDIHGMSDGTADMIAEHLIRLEVLDKWSRELQPEQLLWSLEPEVHISHDKAIIPRLYPYDAGNQRYNTSRRSVSIDANTQEANLVFSGDSGKWEVQVPSPLRIVSGSPFIGETRTIRVTHFLLSTLGILPGCRLMPVIGSDVASQKRFFAITSKAESPVTVPKSWCVSIDEGVDAVHALGLISARMLARSILRLAGQGESLLIHDPHPMIASALQEMGVGQSVALYFTTSSRDNMRPGWQYVDRNLPRRVVSWSLPSSITKFINLSDEHSSSETGSLVAGCLPWDCETIDAACLVGIRTELRPFISEDEVSQEVKIAFRELELGATDHASHPADVSAFTVQDILAEAVGGRFAVANCTSSSVPATVQAIDEGEIFRSDKTYLLVGLTGELGLSLCKWMVKHGARYIVLTSRKPKVDPVFLRGMESMGATVKILPMNITNRESLQDCYNDISSSMPTVGGVANGAMILEDALFDNMSHNAFTKVLTPKVLGSQLLDELFINTPLDFFILFSSTTAVMGNSGQSNYIAANMFMNALAAQRKKRGLAASSVDISSVIGIGYVERAEDLSEDTFLNMGYKPMSEQDLHQLFAEAILLGQTSASEVCELATGVTPIRVDAQASDQYLKDIKFSHFLLESSNSHQHGSGTSSVALRVQLMEIRSREEAASVIKESFLVRLRRVLAISADEAINESVALVELGVDSLMAVEVRSWFLKELDVDIPVLKILGGSTVTDLLDEALNLLPKSIAEFSSVEVLVHGTSKTPTTSASDRTSATNVSQSGSVTPPDTDTQTPDSTSESSAPSITMLTETVEDSQKGSTGRLPGEETSLMSFGQAGFWFLNEYLIDKKTFNMAVMLKLAGEINVSSLQEAVRMLGDCHEILRTRFFWSSDDNDRKPMQAIKPTSALRLDTKLISCEEEAELELQELHGREWDLTSGDAIKILLLSLSDQKSFLLVGMHHIYLDGYSFSNFFKYLEVAYSMHTLPSLLPESQYRSFAAQQRKQYEEEKPTRMVEYYRRTLPEDFQPIELLPFSKLPTRPAVNTYSQHEASIRIDAGVAAKLRQIARRNQCTTFHVYLSALQALIFRLLPAADQICIGIADANRLDKKFLGSLGFFLNLLPLVFHRPQNGTTINSSIKAARDSAYGALQHSGLPFDVLLRELNVPRSAAHTPIFQVFMDYRQVVQERSTWGGCKLEGEKWCNASTGYDIALEVTENVNTDTLLNLRLQDTLYSAESTELLLRSYVNVLDFVMDTADELVENIPIWSPQDTQAALMAGKERPLEPKWGQTIIHRIDQMVAAHGSRTALKDGNGQSLTYDQMDERVNAITERLLASEKAEGSAVGVFQQPSVDWICSMLAIFKAGAVYVPLDMRNSIPRLRAVVQAAQPVLILTDHATTAKVHLIEATTATEMVVSDIGLPGSPQLNRAGHDAVALILFTSGSTGEPKGIMLNHTNLISFTEASSQIFATSDSSIKVLQQSPFSFDFSLDQTFAALANGGCLYIVPATHRGDPSEISRIMIEEGVNYTTATPSEYDLWLRYAGSTLKRCSSWNYAFSGGEAMNHSLAREFLSLELPNLRLFNGYGPAETTILSTKVELAENGLSDPLPAGFMLPGFPVCIVDADLQPVPLGVSGEIVIGGACVASGYLDDAELTGRKFIPANFFGTSRRVYRSGDRGRLFADGSLFCDGRLDGDTQIKLRGFRVELVEVEKALVRYAAGALSHAIVTLRGSGEGRHLAAHVVFGADYTEKSQGEVLKKLRQSLPLPPYMRPAVIMPLTDVPRTPHGKVDRKAVQAMSLPCSQEEPEMAFELTDTEMKLAGLWRKVLPLVPGPITPESDFFVFGGNSILLVKLQLMIREAQFEAPRLVTLMEASSLGAMAAAIQAQGPSMAIDWETESRLSPSMLQETTPSQHVRPRPNPEVLTVLLTGTTGYLGRHLLPEMVKDPKIARIVALVRHIGEGLHAGLAEKVTVHQADISQPLLGLSDNNFHTLAEETDVIIHCAANRSFWDKYEVLRPDNVDAVKYLALLAAHRSIPLHFMSSGGVAPYSDSAALAPPSDGGDGYVATKWVAETFLQHAASTLRIPVHIHRPIGVPSSSISKPTDTNSESAYQTRVINQLTNICNQIGTRPSFEGVRGTVDVAPIERVVQDIQRALHSSIRALGLHGDDSKSPVRIVQHSAELRLSVEGFAAHVQENDHLRNLPSVQILEWFGKAKRSGFEFFMTAQHLIMGGFDGELVSVR